MPEQEPLLQSVVDRDTEAVTDKNRPSLRSRLGEVLESSTTHKIVITLIVIDAACVLADLSYTLLSSGCTPPSGPESPAWLEVLSDISISITTLFLVEIPLALWAFGLQYYNPLGSVTHASLHLFDVSIIVTTFVLEVVLRGKERELASLLIVLRLWRLVKLVGGVAVGAGEIEDDTLKELDETKQKLELAQSALAQAKEENQKLRVRITVVESGSSDDN
ncbi:hypothetical protein EW146_g960 [Bondarzewia mesenterica]|uniref:Hydrogen voltage-gated channel 1 n=1 Tax=Bondarzewia mesenterica TaxID=1095465 RepID=A0A4S4M7G4_9AGAM|nr:hypothetical protein EW146_g960 [Bondarzewia mesenterica]